MAMIRIQKLNVIKEIDERSFQEFKEKGYEKLEDMTAEQPDTPLEDMTAEQLAEYARAKYINIGNATTAKGIIEKIRAAQSGQ